MPKISAAIFTCLLLILLRYWYYWREILRDDIDVSISLRHWCWLFFIIIILPWCHAAFARCWWWCWCWHIFFAISLMIDGALRCWLPPLLMAADIIFFITFRDYWYAPFSLLLIDADKSFRLLFDMPRCAAIIDITLISFSLFRFHLIIRLFSFIIDYIIIFCHCRRRCYITPLLIIDAAMLMPIIAPCFISPLLILFCFRCCRWCHYFRYFFDAIIRLLFLRYYWYFSLTLLRWCWCHYYAIHYFHFHYLYDYFLRTFHFIFFHFDIALSLFRHYSLLSLFWLFLFFISMMLIICFLHYAFDVSMSFSITRHFIIFFIILMLMMMPIIAFFDTLTYFDYFRRFSLFRWLLYLMPMLFRDYLRWCWLLRYADITLMPLSRCLMLISAITFRCRWCLMLLYYFSFT